MSDQPLTRKALREQAEAIARKQAEEQKKLIEEDINQVDVDNEGNPQFSVPKTLTGDAPTTSNIIMPTPPDITAGGSVITESGELVVTGSIDVSALITATGEIPVITQVDDSDADLDQDAKANYIPGIPPIRVSGLIAKTQNQPGIPGGAHKGFNPYVSITLLAIAGLLIAGGVGLAFFFGYF